MKGKKILIGISGGIAAYKICDLVSMLRKEEAEIFVIMTEAATRIITPLTLTALSGRKVYVDPWEIGSDGTINHIEMAGQADCVVIAPATANTIAKVALGIGDNLLTTTMLAVPSTTPILVAPAMNTRMWVNPTFQNNLETLRSVKAGAGSRYSIIEPREGRLACGTTGIGALADVAVLFKAIAETLNAGC